ncbi:unnamed protein product, partial [Rotaria socialis]
LPHLEENIPDDLSYEEPDEDLLENKSDFEALVEVKQQLSVNLVSDDVQNPTTT